MRAARLAACDGPTKRIKVNNCWLHMAAPRLAKPLSLSLSLSLSRGEKQREREREREREHAALQAHQSIYRGENVAVQELSERKIGHGLRFLFFLGPIKSYMKSRGFLLNGSDELLEKLNRPSKNQKRRINLLKGVLNPASLPQRRTFRRIFFP